MLKTTARGDCALDFFKILNMRTDINWAEIKSEYINTFVSKSELADKHKVGRSTLSLRAKKEQWDAERQKQADKNGKEINTIIAKVQVQQGVEKLKLLIQSGDNLCKAIDDKIKEVVESGADTKELKDLITAYRDLIPAIRSVNNLMTVQELETRQIALERLKMERERITRDEVGEQSVEVVFNNEGEAYGE